MTDPKNFELVGVPPSDLLPDVVAAWERAGLDAIEILRRSTEITREFIYDPDPDDIRDRIKPRWVSTKLLPVKNRTLSEVFLCMAGIEKRQQLITFLCMPCAARC